MVEKQSETKKPTVKVDKPTVKVDKPTVKVDKPKAAVKVEKESNSNTKLRIKLKSYDIKMLEASVGKVVGLLIKSGAVVKGPIPLPKKRKLYTVLKSNFKFKDAREQFERMTYSRMVDVVETGAKTMEYLQNLAIPVGVMVDVKVF